MHKYLFFILLIFIPAAAYTVEEDHQLPEDQRLSLDFQNISVRQALQVLADFAHQNMIIDDGVQGQFSLHLKDLPWKQALHIILESRHLHARKMNNVLLIDGNTPNTTPLSIQLFPLAYAKAADLATLLKSNNNTVISAQGSVNVEGRMNALLVQDLPEKIHLIAALIKKLDQPVKQVLIESRIVSIDKSFEHELGIRLGFRDLSTLPLTHHQLNEDLPTTGMDTLRDNLSIGVVLAHLKNNLLLDLELSALEMEGNAKIIASPQLITANLKEATINSGQEIPYQEASASGATSVSFKKAVLSLRVVPQVTPQQKILLNLTVSQDKRGSPEVLGVPPIDTNSISTEVLVRNGQTLVLGGILQKNTHKERQKIPGLGDLPCIGPLFQHTVQRVKESELLIFVTPKILDP